MSTKPDPGTPLDDGSSLANSLVIACCDIAAGTFEDSIGGNTWTPTGGSLSTTAGPNGTALVFPGTGPHLLHSSFAVPTGDCVIWMVIRPRAGAGGAFGNTQLSDPARCFGLIPDGATVKFDYGGASGDNRLSWAYPDGWLAAWHVLAFRTGASGLSIWSDGVEVASSAGVVTRSAGEPGFAIGGLPQYSYHNDCDIECFFLAPLDPSDSVMEDIAADPYLAYEGRGEVPRRLAVVGDGMGRFRFVAG